MTEYTKDDMERFKTLRRSAFVVGYTGAVGKALVNEMNKSKAFSRVVLIGRRAVPLDVGPEFEQKVVDFDNLDQHKEDFKNLDTGFCCLGSRRTKVGLQGFLRTDRDYTLKAAQLAKDQGCNHFNIVTSVGSNKNSRLLYARIKGEVEDQIANMNFGRLSIFRPGFLIAKREESRIIEAAFSICMAPIIYFFPTVISVPVETVARAMLKNAAKPISDPVKEIFENKAIHEAAK